MYDDADTLAPVWLADPVERGHPINRGLAAWWLCLPGLDGGRQWFDLMGLSHGTLTAMTATGGWRGTTRPGGWGHLLFDGSDDQVSLGGTNLVPRSASYTWSAWFRCSATSVLLGFNGSLYAGMLHVGLVVGAGGTVHAVNAAIYVSAWVTAAGTRTVDDGLWHHAVVAYDRAAQTLTLYLDGTPEGSATSTGAIGTEADQLYAGFVPAVGRLTGSFDDVRLYSRVLSAAEVRSLYDLSRRGYPGVLRRWPRPPVPAAAGGLLLARRRVFA